MALPTSSIGGSYNNATSANRASSQGQTFGTAATSAARSSAAAANNQALANWQMAAAYNSEEAAIQRAWQERMANTVYQRTVQDMRKAGINPVLAAGMGLGTASVGGGSAASIGSPESYMATTYPDSMSSSESIGNSQSEGRSWSESGFATFLTSMEGLISGIIGSLISSHNINIALDMIKDIPGTVDKAVDSTKEALGNDNNAPANDKNGKDSSGKRHIAKDINPKKGTFLDGVENFLRARQLL